MRRSALLVLAGCAFALACRQDMHDQPRYKPYRGTDFFGDDRSARPLVEDTVARGQLRDDPRLFTGKEGGQPVDAFPFPVTRAVLERGRQRFTIYCTPCHGQTGQGDGMVVQRGYRRPPSFHIDRLRDQKAGYFYDVITNGFGVMPDYAAQVPVNDRWAIVAYLRVLQLSHDARVEDVPPEHLGDLASPAPGAPATPAGHEPMPPASPPPVPGPGTTR